jgi:hypothetical protein
MRYINMRFLIRFLCAVIIKLNYKFTKLASPLLIGSCRSGIERSKAAKHYPRTANRRFQARRTFRYFGAGGEPTVERRPLPTTTPATRIFRFDFRLTRHGVIPYDADNRLNARPIARRSFVVVAFLTVTYK